MDLVIKTKKKKEVIDITDEIESVLDKKNFKNGLVNVFVKHTTCSVTLMDLDPGTDEDFLDAITKIFPKGTYRHPHDPSHVGEHIMSTIIGQSVNVPVKSGKLILGTWQRLVLIELSGPRERNLIVTVMKDS